MLENILLKTDLFDFKSVCKMRSQTVCNYTSKPLEKVEITEPMYSVFRVA